jgi:hypothetical protein
MNSYDARHDAEWDFINGPEPRVWDSQAPSMEIRALMVGTSQDGAIEPTDAVSSTVSNMGAGC